MTDKSFKWFRFVCIFVAGMIILPFIICIAMIAAPFTVIVAAACSSSWNEFVELMTDFFDNISSAATDFWHWWILTEEKGLKSSS